MKKLLLAVLVVTASGCVNISDLGGGSSEAELIAKASDQKITADDPGEITLNARNKANSSTFYYATVRPVGDYNEVIQVADRNGDPKSGFGLGDAPEGATTGETFAQVQKELNITSTVRVKVELYNGDNDELIQSEIKKLKLVEED